MIDTNNLFQEFAPISTEEWIDSIEKHLKGKSIDSLNWEIEEGLVISPTHRKNDSKTQYLGSINFANNNDWKICEEITVNTSNNNYIEANKNILHGLDKGANSLILELNQLPTPAELEILLRGIHLELISIHFKGAALYASPLEFLKILEQTPTAQTIHGSCDLGELSEDILINAINLFAETMSNIRFITISIEDNSTKSLSQALYNSSLWIDKLLKNGKNIKQTIGYLRFEFNIGDHYFLELASIRAFKKLWLGLLEAYNAPKAIMPVLHATTKSDQNENQYWNMITATTQAMAAALAGVDSISIRPCNGKEKADDFTRRIARNVQHILQSESYLNRVVDPSAGSYYIENLTVAIAEKAWQQFCNL
jgi:methylmalonyl-CoA mutase